VHESALADDSLYYTGLALDRASSRRSDPAWLQAQRAGPDVRVIPLWDDKCLVSGGQPISLDAASEAALPDGATVFLGLSAGTPVFAADLSALDRADALALAGADAEADVRTLIGAIGRDEAGMLAYARGLLHWQRRQRFCGCCGGRCEPRDGGHLRVCAECATLHFPKIEPATIVLVELPGEPRRCLLGRHQGAAPGRYSTLAGFVEIGESLEDAVRREVAEEAGVTVRSVRYQGSQAWPFPAGIMLGFRAVAAGPDIAVDGAELTDARWFTDAEVRARIADSGPVPPCRHDSIGRALIEGWLAESADRAESC
jgi:NAD+ diphosphatase